MHCSVLEETTAQIVIDTFTWCINHYGAPQSTLRDNELVYTTRLLKLLNKFGKLLTTLGIRQKNGKPYHPQTQAKIERFHHTEHLWVNARPQAKSITELPLLLNEFQQVYNTERPHRALNRETPQQWYRRTLKARQDLKNATRDREFRIRHDRIGNDGKLPRSTTEDCAT
ncbi:integrase core domain-containing protein [Glutamicibacter sp. TV12E]|uniref:integrase core domain-containing protein n=1 Tax=Glutamicibacter sp. TV12E TaxID=3446362 RepID=UPI00403424D4